jgi:hypothetical protein
VETFGAFLFDLFACVQYNIKMKKFDYVEDYIEVISGYRDGITGKKLSHYYYGISPIINLARYDVSVFETMCEQVLQNNALTERQGALACKLILKYQRQLSNKLIDVSPLEHPVWRVSLRKMDYTRSLSLREDKLILKFPFNNELIESIREFSRESQGEVKWSRDDKVWKIGLTEYNLNWSVTWANINKFNIDTEVSNLFEKISSVESSGYSIELHLDTSSNMLSVSNADCSLINYINDNLGGFGLENLLNLADMSSILGYTINKDLADAISKEYGHRFYQLVSNREVKINPNTMLVNNDFESVIDYAVQCNRLPVVVYEPDLSNRMLEKLQSLYPAEQIFESKNQNNPEVPEGKKFVHTYKPLRNISKIPLIISSAGMVFGGDKQLMIQRAEKVVYCAVDVYNKKQIGKKVKDIAG